MVLQTRQVAPQPDLPGPINHGFPELATRNVHIAGPNMDLKPSPLAGGKLRLFLNSFDASVRFFRASAFVRYDTD